MTSAPPVSSHPARLALGAIAALAAVKLAAHLGASAFGPYEFHRDAFLYFAMGEHLRLWHMDFPPFIAMLANATRAILGDGIVALRSPIALASTLLLIFAALTAHELGGGRFAQALAAFGVLASALFLRSGTLFQPVALDQLWWTVALFALVKLGSKGNPRWWLVYGAACGLGLLTKFSVLIFGTATLIALLVTRERRHLATPWPWIAGLMTFAIGSPSIVGQFNLGFPVLEYTTDLQRAQLARVSWISFIMGQPMESPGFLIAVPGAVALVTSARWQAYRLVGWTTIAAFALLLLLNGKSYYAGPIYPVLYGAGAVVLERVRRPRLGPAVRWATVGLLAAYLVVLLPIGLPIMPPATLERYSTRLGLQEETATTNRGAQERIPQDFGDMLNWEAQVREVARVYHTLPEPDRSRAVIFASNYGEAGAIDFYGPRYDLPGAIAITGTYWFFGPGDLPGDIVIFHGFRREEIENFCGEIEDAGSVTHPFAVTEERDLTVRVCRNNRQTLQSIWPSLSGRN